jgi:hypothetical protein
MPLFERGRGMPLSKRGIPPNDEPNATPNMIDLGAEDIEFQESDVHSTSQLDVHNLGVCPFSKGAGAPDSSGLGVSPFLKGATYCGRTNKHVKNKSIQSRLDRIYVKIKRNSLKVHFYGLTGTFTQPSDHFGVFAQIEF